MDIQTQCLPLHEVLITGELAAKASRDPQYQLESKMMGMLAQQLADEPASILQGLTDAVVSVLGFQSAGVSLVTDDGTAFYWPAVSGVWTPNIGGGTPRDFGPCGDVIDGNAPLLFKRPARRYEYISTIEPAIEECLLVPFYLKGAPVGTIWALSHDHTHSFDNEDLRLMLSLGKFASSAYQTIHSMQSLEASQAEAVRLHDELQALHKERQAELKDELDTTSQSLLRTDEELRAITMLVSQQIQEPAKIVSSYLKLLAVRYKDRLGTDADEFIDKCLEGSDSIMRMLDDLWNYTHAITEVERQNSSLMRSLDEALEELKELIAQSNATIEKPDTLPCLLLNEKHMQFIWAALIDNAIKFCRSGNKPEIIITCSEQGDDYLLTVADKGIGVDTMNFKDIFKPFVRVNARPDESGSGMSLPIVQRMITNHGGTIWVEHDLEHTRFCFTLPATVV